MEKFYLIEKIINLREIKSQIQFIGELMQKTYRSLAVLELLEQLLLDLGASSLETDENYYLSKGAFLKEVGLFLLHYPIEKTLEEDAAVRRVGMLLGQSTS